MTRNMYEGVGAEMYDDVVQQDSSELQWIISTLGVYNPKLVTELACGSGRVTVPLSRAFPDATINAVDNSGDLLSTLQNRLTGRNRNVRVVLCDILSGANLPEADSVVIATSSLALFNRPQRESILRSIRESIPRGRPLLVTNSYYVESGEMLSYYIKGVSGKSYRLRSENTSPGKRTTELMHVDDRGMRNSVKSVVHNIENRALLQQFVDDGWTVAETTDIYKDTTHHHMAMVLEAK